MLVRHQRTDMMQPSTMYLRSQNLETSIGVAGDTQIRRYTHSEDRVEQVRQLPGRRHTSHVTFSVLWWLPGSQVLDHKTLEWTQMEDIDITNNSVFQEYPTFLSPRKLA